MKNNFFILIITISFFIFFGSCSTDVNINADYKEIPIVYCVLDPSMEYQFVKVNKAFLGEKDVAEMAQVSDSLYFKSNVNVVLKKYNKEELVASWNFDYCDTIKKDEGFFANDKNILYAKKINFGENTKNNTYELIVDIGNGKHIIKNKLKLNLVTDIDVYTRQAKDNSVTNYKMITIANYENSFFYEYRPGNSAVTTEVYLKFNYFEVLKSDTTYKSILLPILKNEGNTNNNNDAMKKTFNIASFYDIISNTIPVVEGIKRYVVVPNSYNFIVYSAEENYYIYTQVTKPSTGIVQFRPTYTNLEGGLGIFASRNSFMRTYQISKDNIDTLYRGIYTKKLGFVDPIDNYYHTFFPLSN